MKYAIFTCFEILFVVITFTVLAIAVAEEPEGLKIGDAAPPLTLRNLDGQMVFLSDFCGPECPANKRKPVVVHFFGVHCKPCEKEIPAFQRIFADEISKKVAWVFVDVCEPLQDVVAYKSKLNLSVLILHDNHATAAKDWKITDNRGGAIMPYTYLLDKDGFVRLSLKGAHENLDTFLINELKLISN